jgi:Domain of unknown function (DUF4276)
MPVRVGCIVEGHGDLLGLPILIRRLAQLHDPSLTVTFEFRRISRSQLLRPGELERLVEAITRQIGRSTPLLVLLDSDKDCPLVLAQGLLDRCKAAHADVPVSVVVAKCEYEAWFLAAADSLAGRGGLRVDVAAPQEPEEIRGAKEWLSARMISGARYSETRHQPLFSSLLEIDQARKSRSFRKLEREISRMWVHSTE